MKKNHHSQRKCHQLKNNELNNGPFDRSLILKRKNIINQLKNIMSAYWLKRLFTPAVLGLIMTIQNPVEAQEFGGPVQDPFGISTSEEIFIAPVLVDIDADGDLDLFSGGHVNNYTSGIYFFQENIGTKESPLFGEIKENPFELSKTEGSFYPAFADLDDDGDLDLIASSNIICFDYYLNVYYPKIGITYYENVGNSKEPVFKSLVVNPFNFTVPQESDFMFPELGDLDSDGDFDILVSDSDGAITYYENIGTKESPKFDQPISNPFGLELINYYSVSLKLYDLDNDGDLDVIKGQQLHNNYTELPETKLFYYENNGNASSPSFGTTDSIQLIGTLNGTAISTFGDLDADGDLDMIVSQFQQPTLYYENKGDSSNPVFGGMAVSIQEIKEFYVSIYPNPTKNILNIKSFDRIKNIEIINIKGQVIKQINKAQQRISLNDLPSGTYLVKITNVHDKQKIKKLYKN